MRTTSFSTKDQYLQYRKEWKEEYKQISQTIRERKYIRNERNRIFNKALNAHGYPQSYSETNPFWVYYSTLERESPKYMELKKKYASDHTPIETYKKEATAMLEELKEAKKEAQRQYLASKKELVSA